jgi:wobble nucleotide-excising tRNase
MSTILTAEDLFDIRDFMADLARKIDNFRISHSTQISAFFYSELQNWSSLIKNRVFELTGQALNQLATDLEEPAANLKKAIEQLGDALKKIETFNKIVNYIADVINIFGVIVRAVSTGLASANIASAFDSLKDLFQLS